MVWLLTTGGVLITAAGPQALVAEEISGVMGKRPAVTLAGTPERSIENGET